MSTLRMPTKDELIACYVKCKKLEKVMSSRQAGGGNKSGRYKKHDTARKRCLQRVVYPDLRLGKLPSELDSKMLFDAPGPCEISGPMKQQMDQWSSLFTRDAKPTTKDKETMEEDHRAQTDLLRWAANDGGPSIIDADCGQRGLVGRPTSFRGGPKIESPLR